MTLLASPAAPAAGQNAADSAPSLLAWMGLDPGDTMAFDSNQGFVCVTVGEPRRIEDRAVAPLLGLIWPGLASDSRIFVPLDGELDFLVDRTPGPGATVQSLLTSGSWSGFESDWSSEDSLFYRSCPMCMDAGLTILLEKGKGIRWIVEQSFAGPTSLVRVEGGCAVRDGDAEFYVEPASEREP